MPLPPGVAVTKAVGEPEIPDLRARSRRGRRDRRLPVGRPAVLLVGQHAAFPILFDRLDLEVFEDVHSAAGAQLKGKGGGEGGPFVSIFSEEEFLGRGGVDCDLRVGVPGC